MNVLKVLLLALAVANGSATPVLAQECPDTGTNGPSVPSRVLTLEGRLVFHDDLRQWFELRLDRPQCGQKSIQLVSQGNELEVLRGCRVRSIGPIDFSPTGYYSLDTYQNVARIGTVGACKRQPPFRDYSHATPDKSIRRYRVEMHVLYDREHPAVFRVSSAGKPLQPWQAYASYQLTGGFVLYGLCGKGFVVDEVFGTPEGHPGHFDEPRDPADMAMFDPESAAAAGKKDLHLGWTCVREE